MKRSLDAEEEDDEVDEDDFPPQTIIAIVGKSNSGKSSLCRWLLTEFKDYNAPVKLLNDRSKDPTPYERISWGDLASIRECALWCEDLIQLRARQISALSVICDHGSHHRFISPVLLVAHSVAKTNIKDLQHTFDRIYVTCKPQNISTFKKVLRDYGFEDSVRLQLAQDFLNCKIPYASYYVDLNKHQVSRVTFPFLPETYVKGKKSKKVKKAASMSSRQTLALANAEKYLSVLPNSKESLCIFQILMHKLPASSIEPNTLEITLSQKGSRLPVSISLVEYCATLVDEKNKLPASPQIRKLHKYAVSVRGVILPRHYVLNPDFR
jgi:hypothetical protein